MTTNKIIISTFLFLFFSVGLMAQKSAPFYYGKLITPDEGTKEVRYKRSLNPIDNSTKYSIDLDGIEIYEVDFKYIVNEKIKKADSLRIDFYDKKTAKSSNRYLKFEPCYSHVIVQDYEVNIESIDELNPRSILFSIDRYINDKEDSLFITLYQFLGIGGELFVLTSVPSNVLAKHQDAVNDWKRCKIIDDNDSLLVVKMLEVKETTLNSIKTEIDFLQNKKPTVKAKDAMQANFKVQMDRLIPEYYKNIFSSTEDSFDVHFNFDCNGYGKILINDLTMNFKNRTDKNNWFKDSFMLNLKPTIERMEFQSGTENFSKPSLKYDFDRRFNIDSIRKLFKFPTKFQEPIEEIYTAFTPYTSIEIKTPLIYTYAIKYASKKDHVSWKFLGFDENNHPRIKIQEPPKLVDFTEEDLKTWINNQSTLPSKKNESEITIVYINDEKVNIDIKTTPK